MPASHATDPELSPEDRALLAPDAARADHTSTRREELRQRLDFEEWGQRAAERSRPHRQARAHERSERQHAIDSLRTGRKVEHTLTGLDRRFARFADARPTNAAVSRWAIATRRGQRRDGLVIAGPVGTGKTYEAVGAFRFIVQGAVHDELPTLLPAVAVTVPALLDGLRPGREVVETLSACEEARLLLLDDLAAERHTDWTGETLYRLIDARYARSLPTIITTNATGTMIRDTLGDRVASRLNGLGAHVVLDGPDRRAASTVD